jgi:hypothetical protein
VAEIFDHLSFDLVSLFRFTGLILVVVSANADETALFVCRVAHCTGGSLL